MNSDFNPVRYDTILTKNPREILMLRGTGCQWRKCTFCDYHLDFSSDEVSNLSLNSQELSKVTGKYHRLEIINSGSFHELGNDTIALIRQTCLEKNIAHLHFEMHWQYRSHIPALRRYFGEKGIFIHVKMGVETFDADFRDDVLRKGMEHAAPLDIFPYADEVCLLFGLTGQTVSSMKYDIETGLSLFDRICINIMVENTTKVKPDASVIQTFQKELFPLYRNNPRVDILMNNTDFGVGGQQNDQ